MLDGLFYWDEIGPEWFRLIRSRDNEVLGNVRRDSSSDSTVYTGTTWLAQLRVGEGKARHASQALAQAAVERAHNLPVCYGPKRA